MIEFIYFFPKYETLVAAESSQINETQYTLMRFKGNLL